MEVKGKKLKGKKGRKGWSEKDLMAGGVGS